MGGLWQRGASERQHLPPSGTFCKPCLDVLSLGRARSPRLAHPPSLDAALASGTPYAIWGSASRSHITRLYLHISPSDPRTIIGLPSASSRALVNPLPLHPTSPRSLFDSPAPTIMSTMKLEHQLVRPGTSASPISQPFVQVFDNIYCGQADSIRGDDLIAVSLIPLLPYRSPDQRLQALELGLGATVKSNGNVFTAKFPKGSRLRSANGSQSITLHRVRPHPPPNI